ncbi:MAG: transposase [Candidatus Kuenenbacteria bacterium]
MSRPPRIDMANYVYHIINRANAKVDIFNTNSDYQLFEQILTEAKEKTSMRILSYCVMPNHWHLVIYPKKDGDLSRFTGWITLTHTQRWHVAHDSTGSGHLYQGRYKSFLVEEDEYFLKLVRYVERNPLKAELVEKAENWRWSSLYRREKGTNKEQKILSSWPIDMPDDYLQWVNTNPDNEEIENINSSIIRSKPYGKELWANKIIKQFGLETTVRSKGRPKKGS